MGVYADQDGKLVRTERVELDVAGARTDVPELVGVLRASTSAADQTETEPEPEREDA